MLDLENIINKSVSPFRDNENQTADSVVCLLYKENEIFFIHRSQSMPTHKGDIAFVGGHINHNEKILDAACREFEEELNISKQKIIFKGYLDSVQTSSKNNVFVCCFSVIETKVKFLTSIKSNGEWTEGFFVEYSHFLNKDNWSFSVFRWSDDMRKIYFCKIPFKKKNLWGMTASVIYKLFEKNLNNAIKD